MTPRPRISSPPTTHRWGRRAALFATLFLTTVALTACTSGSGDTVSNSSTRGVVPMTPGEPLPGQIELEQIPSESTADRDVISTATVSLESPDPADAADSVAAIATDAGGRVDNRTDSPATDGSGGSGTLTLRIPAAALDDALVEIKEIGELRGASVGATDVTDQVTDLDARITALRTSVDRLLGLIGAAATTADLIAVEGALSERQAELDSLEAQRASIGDAITFATVTVDISSPAVVAGAAPGDFWGGIVVGFSALVTFFSGLLVVLGVLVPWLLVVAVLAAIGWLVVRSRLAARRGALVPEPSTPGAPPRPPLPADEPRSPGAGGTGGPVG